MSLKRLIIMIRTRYTGPCNNFSKRKLVR